MAAAAGGSSSPASECGALRGLAQAPARSYGSTARHPGSPTCQRHLEHWLRPGDTLQGLALRYGVSTEQIKRANRLYTNESIFLKETIRIPAANKQEALLNGLRPEAMPEKRPGEGAGSDPLAAQDTGGTDRLAPELSASDFLKRLDSKISQSKAAAIKKLEEGGGGAAGAPSCEQLCSAGRAEDWTDAPSSMALGTNILAVGDAPLPV
ncbi:lysM and putative peptidoglycan-binding domain-containing protein 1 isoform X2 [Heptranchias perlo]|uniref:lysM and putative peptidoglycan-binding domain-containing protein 1 isoform X2 n=1 Tax=Heptranchias perlo TaxID=212740 RepID=UPI00355A0BE8